MEFRSVLFLSVIVAVISHTTSLFNNPGFGFDKVAKQVNGADQLLSRSSSIRQMQIKNPVSPFVFRHKSTPYMAKVDGQVTSFNWTTCGKSNQIFDIKTLTLKPSPLSFPGRITFSFDIILHENLDKADNITVAVTLKFKTGTTWLKIPCLDNIGSCTYTNLCSKLAGLSCPPELKKQGIKCHCPLLQGEYKLQPAYSVDIESPVFIYGNYTAMVDITSTTKGSIGCYRMAFDIV